MHEETVMSDDAPATSTDPAMDEEPFAVPATMSPQQRRQEIAAFLARGVLRLRRSASPSPSAGGSRLFRTSDNFSESREDCLDEGAKPVPHVAAR